MRTFAEKPKATSANASSVSRAQIGQDHDPTSILHLQRMIGNQPVNRLLQSNTEERNAVLTGATGPHFEHDFSRIPIFSPTPVRVQPKLTVGTPGDIYEEEADHFAEQVLRMPEPRIQRICACGGVCPRCRNESEGKKELQVQRLEASSWSEVGVPLIVQEVLRSPGQPLEAEALEFMESRFGYDFSQVRVHTDTKASDSARSVNARAYTVGRDIVFGVGEYAPHSPEGKRLLAHELSHTVQQGAKDKVQTHEFTHKIQQTPQLQRQMENKDTGTIGIENAEVQGGKACYDLSKRHDTYDFRIENEIIFKEKYCLEEKIQIVGDWWWEVKPNTKLLDNKAIIVWDYPNGFQIGEVDVPSQDTKGPGRTKIKRVLKIPSHLVDKNKSLEITIKVKKPTGNKFLHGIGRVQKLG